MNPQHRFAAFSLLLLFTACYLSWPLQATDEGAINRHFAESIPTLNSSRLPQTAQPGQVAGSGSPADDAGPLFPVESDGYWGYIGKTGKIVITPVFNDAYPFVEGVGLVRPTPDKYNWRFIDRTGETIASIGRIYSYAQSFSEGLALVGFPWEKDFGYIDKTGKMVISLHQYDSAGKFREGLARVRVGGKWGYIDKTGNIVITPVFNDAYPFAEGLAAVKVAKKWGYIDKTGKIVIPPQYDLAYEHTEGLAAVKTDGKWGHIDKTGNMVIPPQFSEASGFVEGLAEVKVGKKWGYIDKTGQMVIAPQYDTASEHSGGFAAVKLGGKWGYIDKTGQMVIPPQYDTVTTFSEGLALVHIGGKWGYIDKTGMYVWGPTK